MQDYRVNHHYVTAVKLIIDLNTEFHTAKYENIIYMRMSTNTVHKFNYTKYERRWDEMQLQATSKIQKIDIFLFFGWYILLIVNQKY